MGYSLILKRSILITFRYNVLLLVTLLISYNSVCSAQLGGPRRQVATIIFSGLGGAVLGLSTLSFYPRPQEHLQNVSTGLALGIVAGTSYVVWNTSSSLKVGAINNIEYSDSQKSSVLLAQKELKVYPTIEGLGFELNW